MSCIFHDIPVGTKVSPRKSVCMFCGAITEHHGTVWTYLGNESPFAHKVYPEVPFDCSGCGRTMTKGVVPCRSNSGVWEIISYPVSELIKK